MKNNIATGLTRVEGGKIVTPPFDLYEHEILGVDYEVEKKEVFSKLLKKPIVTRVIKIDKVWVHSLFFDDGKIYDVKPSGFTLRPTTTAL